MDTTKSVSEANMLLYLFYSVPNILHVEIITEGNYNAIVMKVAGRGVLPEMMIKGNNQFVQHVYDNGYHYYEAAMNTGLNGETWGYYRTNNAGDSIDDRLERIREILNI